MPSAAIQRGPQGSFVYVVKEDKTVTVRPVTVGEIQRGEATIKTGISPGEMVVTDGADRLREGAKVELRSARGWFPKGPVMNISRLFITRPVATTLLMVAIFLSGVVAYKQLPVSALPQVDYPTIQVRTFYPGGSPTSWPHP